MEPVAVVGAAQAALPPSPMPSPFSKLGRIDAGEAGAITDRSRCAPPAVKKKSRKQNAQCARRKEKKREWSGVKRSGVEW